MVDTSHANWQNLSDWERIVSSVGGALMLGYGLTRRPSMAGTLAAAGGALLLERGLSGHCSLYRALGLDSRDTHQLRRRARHDAAVERAAEDSFPASDPPSWSPHTAGSPATVD
jgi:uncharacterized membrane protein